MTVRALYDYQHEAKDTMDRFHGNQLLYVGWEQHLMFCSAHCVPVPPDMPFQALLDEVLPGMYDSHPEWSQVDWDKAEWLLNHKPFKPDPSKSLQDQGIDHKSILRFRTPGLNSIGGVAT